MTGGRDAVMPDGSGPTPVAGAVVFTDLVGFTEYTDAAGDVAALHVLDIQTQLATAALGDRRDARIVKELGDGLMMWFSSAGDALDTATTLMASIAAARVAGEFPLAVRMGIHHGAAIARGDDIVGQTINIGARVSDIAGPGELLVSDDVIAACETSISSFGLQPVGPVVVKGVRQPIWLQRVSTDR